MHRRRKRGHHRLVVRAPKLRVASRSCPSTAVTLCVTHENFAPRVNSSTYYSGSFKAWYLGPFTNDLIP